MGITLRTRGDWSRTKNWLKKMEHEDYIGIINKYGEVGCQYLAEYTPKRTGKTAASWYYTVEHDAKGFKIIWSNSNMDDHGITPIAILIQYGHGTGTGGYVAPVDYINPAIKPVFENLAEAVWREVCES